MGRRFFSHGVVLRKLPYSEADDIATLLTHEHGVIRVFARGARKSRRRFGSTFDIFAHARFDLEERSSGLPIIHNSELLAGGKVRHDDLIGFAFASFLSELIAAFSPEGESNSFLYELWLSAAEERSHELVHAGICAQQLLQFLVRFGYGMSFDRCRNCHNDLQGNALLLRATGGVVCHSCSSHKLEQAEQLGYDALRVLSGGEPISAELGTRILPALVSHCHAMLHREAKAGESFLNFVEQFAPERAVS